MLLQMWRPAATQAVQVMSASPGAFTLDEIGSGPVAAANQDGTINGPSHPAAKGSYVTVYWTGGGQTNPPGVNGSVRNASRKASVLEARPQRQRERANLS